MNLYQELFRYRHFIRFTIDRHQRGGLYKTVLGRAWLIILPLSHILIYYLLIVVIFGAGSADNMTTFVTLMTGITHYLFFQSALLSSCSALLARESLLMQVHIEPAVFTVTEVAKACIDFVTTLALFGLIYVWHGEYHAGRLIWYPAIMLVLMIVIWSWALTLSVLTVFFRDVQHLVSIVLRMLMYLVPVVYTLDFVPLQAMGLPFRELYLLNPMASLFALLQWSLLSGQMPSVASLASLVLFVMVSGLAGHAAYGYWGRRIAKGF
jgi:ABC-2 type transport system permease protein